MSSMVVSAEGELQRILKFLAIELPKEGERACVKIGLYMGPVGSSGQEIHTWHRADTPRLFEDVSGHEQLANQIFEAAREHASGSGPGQYRFEVRTQQHLQGIGRRAFMVNIEGSDEFTGLVDPPTVPGQIAQQMRHSEFLMMQMFRMTSQFTTAMQRQIQILAEDNQQLWASNAKMKAELDHAQEAQHARFSALLLAEKADARKDELMKYALPLLPVLVSRWLSDGGPTGQNAALTFAIQRLLSSLDAPTRMEMVGKLTPEQRLMFLEIMRLSGEMQAPAPSGGQGPPGSPSPAAPTPAAPTPPPRS